MAWVQGSLRDFEMFYPLMNDPFIISIHDTRNAYGYADGGVVATISVIRERCAAAASIRTDVHACIADRLTYNALGGGTSLTCSSGTTSAQVHTRYPG